MMGGKMSKNNNFRIWELGKDVFVDRPTGFKDIKDIGIYENDIVEDMTGRRFRVTYNNYKAVFVFQPVKGLGKGKYYSDFSKHLLPLRIVDKTHEYNPFSPYRNPEDIKVKLPELPGMFCYFQEGADGSVFVEAFRFDKIKHMRIYPDHDPAGIWADVLAGDTDFTIGGEDAERFISEYSAYEFGGTI